jgi:hypothetical protein
MAMKVAKIIGILKIHGEPHGEVPDFSRWKEE